MRSLRLRFVISHILPLIVTVPLIGLALFNILQTQILLTNLTREIQTQAVLLVEITSQRADLWYSPATAQAFVTRISSQINAHVMLLDTRGVLLASSDPLEESHAGQEMNLTGLNDALRGKTSTEVNYDSADQTDVIQMLVPVLNQNQQLLGVIRLNIPIENIRSRVLDLRSMITWVLGGGLLLGGLLGLLLAINLERPLIRTTQAIFNFSLEQNLNEIPEQGPTEVRMLIRAFNTMTTRLKSLEDNRKKLLANLIHELGRPLGALHSAIEALEGGADEDIPLRHDLLTGMDGEIHRLQHLLEDLSNLREQIVGTLELNFKPIELSPWLVEILSPWREDALAKNIEWEIDLPTNLPTLLIDPDRIAQVVENLVSNAIKYTPSGKSVIVSAGVVYKQVWIKVSDIGMGISPEEQELIFTAFYRSKQVRRFPQGMGLGLTIANELVHAHGGYIELNSSPDTGSQFTIWLPIQ